MGSTYFFSYDTTKSRVCRTQVPPATKAQDGQAQTLKVPCDEQHADDYDEQVLGEEQQVLGDEQHGDYDEQEDGQHEVQPLYHR